MLKGTFRQLEIFCVVAESGSFTAAAERLEISQVSVSRQIAALERHWGCELFARRRGATGELTPEGERFLKKVPDLLEGARHLAASVGNKPVRVGAGDMLLELVIYPGIAPLHQAHPALQVEFVELDPSLQTAARMAKLGVDLCYFSLTNPPHQVQGEMLLVVESSVYCSPDFYRRWAGKRGRKPVPMILPLQGASPERLMRRNLEESGWGEIEVASRCQRVSARLQLALSGLGACCTPDRLAEPYVRDGGLVKFGPPLNPIYRYAFRTAGIQRAEARIVDEFLCDLLKRG